MTESVQAMSEDSITNAVEVPNEFVAVDQWICWREEERDGKPTKIPVTPGSGAFASSTDSETWTDFETAFEYAESDEADGLGFVFSADDPFVGIDLDDCRDPETRSIDDDARDIVNRLDSYTEISPSGTGFHVLIQGELPEGGNRHGNVEMYDSARFFTMTGDRVDVKPQTVNERQEALDAVHREYVQEPSMGSDEEASEETTHAVDTETPGLPEESATDVTLSDEELLEKARNAGNGEKFDRLWRGGTSGYPSQSEADMALCCLLAFWTGGDVMRVDQLFRKSGLLREKWNEVHFSNGDTYGERTVKRAIDNTDEFYEPAERSTESETETSDDFAAEFTAASNGPSAETRGMDTDASTKTTQAETSGSAETTQTAGEPGETTETGTGDSSDGRERAYLKERNTVLSAKLEQREATIDELQERVETLESELAELQSQTAGSTQSSLTETTNDASDGSANRSLWDRAKGLIKRGST